MRPYDSEDAALTDALRLSEGMTYKNAAAGLPLGGGKAVIIGDASAKTSAQLLTFARAINTLEGDYWTAEDMGMSPSDMALLATETKFVAGLPDGPHASGDPSPITARGIFNCDQTSPPNTALATTDPERPHCRRARLWVTLAPIFATSCTRQAPS